MSTRAGGRHPLGSRRAARGQALVETALAIPILLLVVFAVFEAGAFGFTMMTVTHATQDGGRLAALPDTPDEASIRTYVQDRAAQAPVSINPADITITVTSCAVSPCGFNTRASGDRIRVRVTYTYNPLILGVVFGSSISLTTETEYHVE